MNRLTYVESYNDSLRDRCATLAEQNTSVSTQCVTLSTQYVNLSNQLQNNLSKQLQNNLSNHLQSHPSEMAMYRIGPDLGWFPIRSELFIRDSGPMNLELGANPVRSGSELHQQNSNSCPVTHI